MEPNLEHLRTRGGSSDIASYDPLFRRPKHIVLFLRIATPAPSAFYQKRLVTILLDYRLSLSVTLLLESVRYTCNSVQLLYDNRQAHQSSAASDLP